MKTTRFLLTAFAAAMMMTACEGDDNMKSVPDPAGTITANISASTDISFSETGNHEAWYLWWTTPNNFVIASNSYFTTSNFDFYRICVCDVGRVGGLGSITEIPTSGYSQQITDEDDSIACQVGHGYIFKMEKLYYGQPTGDISYVRLYVAEKLTNGAKVKYQYPFIPE